MQASDASRLRKQRFSEITRNVSYFEDSLVESFRRSDQRKRKPDNETYAVGQLVAADR